LVAQIEEGINGDATLALPTTATEAVAEIAAKAEVRLRAELQALLLEKNSAGARGVV
jgi:hypothetical protein